MRVLMLSWEYPPHLVGGLGVHVAALVPALARRGVEVTLVTPRWSGGEPVERIAEGAVVYRVDPPDSLVGNFFADTQETNLNVEELAHRLWEGNGKLPAERAGGFDLIHAHDWLVAFAANSLKRLHKTPLVATLHATERGRGRGQLGGEISNAINGAEWWLAYEAWRVIAASQFMAAEISSYFQVPGDKIDIVPNGVEMARYNALAGDDLDSFRARWARPEERLVFFVGRLQYEKGPQVLIEAAHRVVARFPDVKFVLAGTGAMSDSLQRRIEELGASERISLVGHVSDDDKDRLFAAADVAVFPSLYEPFGIAALEAMAAGTPVVVSDVGGLREVVRDHETGLVVPAESADGLANGILQVLAHPDEAEEKAARARGIVREEYNWDIVARHTVDVYERVIRERALVAWA